MRLQKKTIFSTQKNWILISTQNLRKSINSAFRSSRVTHGQSSRPNAIELLLQFLSAANSRRTQYLLALFLLQTLCLFTSEVHIWFKSDRRPRSSPGLVRLIITDLIAMSCAFCQLYTLQTCHTRPLFCFIFLMFTMQRQCSTNFTINDKSEVTWCAWDLNLWWQDGRCKPIH